MPVIELHPDLRAELQEHLRAHLNDILDPEDAIGDLKASLILDFILDQIGPGIYNQALNDLQQHVVVRLSDAVDGLYKAPPK